MESFNNLFHSIETCGYESKFVEEDCLIDKDKNIINAAHRVSICAALNLDIEAQIINESKSLFSTSDYLASNGSEEFLDAALLLKARLYDELQCLVIHGIVNQSSIELIEERIKSRARIYYKKKKNLKYNELLYLKYINYVLYKDSSESEWCGNLKNGFRGLLNHANLSYGNGETYFYFLQDVGNEELNRLKTDIRIFLNLGNHALHTCDSRNEVIDVAYFACHRNTIRFYSHVDARFNFDILERIRTVNKELNTVANTNDLIVGGSFVLELYSLRKSRDIDVFGNYVEKDLVLNAKGIEISVSPFESSHYPFDVLEFNLNPQLSFRYGGLFFMTLDSVSKMKTFRMDFPKDKVDLALIEDFVQGKVFSYSVHNFKLLLYWKIRAFASHSRITTLQFLYKFRSLRIIKRVLRYITKRIRVSARRMF